MDNVVSLVNRRTKKEQQNANSFLPVSADLSHLVNQHLSYGVSNLEVIAATLNILGRMIAIEDPSMKHEMFRDVVKNMLDKQIDNHILQLWEADQSFMGEEDV